MKRTVLYVALAVIVIGACFIDTDSRVYDKNQYLYLITVNTHTAVTGGGWLPGRVYYKAKNISASYRVMRASWNFEHTDYGEGLDANGGWWEDKYNVYQSSWWYLIIEDGPANVAEYTASVQIQERD